MYDTKKYNSQYFFCFFTLAAEFTKQFYIKTRFTLQYMLTRVWATCTVTNRRPDYSGLLIESRRRYFHCGIITLGLYSNKSMFSTCTYFTKSLPLYICSALSKLNIVQRWQPLHRKLPFVFPITVKAWIFHTAWLIRADQSLKFTESFFCSAIYKKCNTNAFL